MIDGESIYRQAEARRETWSVCRRWKSLSAKCGALAARIAMRLAHVDPTNTGPIRKWSGYDRFSYVRDMCAGCVQGSCASGGRCKRMPRRICGRPRQRRRPLCRSALALAAACSRAVVMSAHRWRSDNQRPCTVEASALRRLSATAGNVSMGPACGLRTLVRRAE